MRHLDADAVAALGPAGAVEAIRSALLGGLDPATDLPRTPVDLGSGQLLLMPSDLGGAAGVKVATVAPGNPARGLPRIQATYLLFDRETLALTATLDGTALTTLRTPAVSVAAVLDRLPTRPLRVVAVGAGPQAVAHVATVAAVRRVERVTYCVRTPGRTDLPAVALGSDAAGSAIADADVVVCATSARTPVLDDALVDDHAVVIAVGSHEPDARELPAALLRRSTVVVEDVAAALREAGDVVLAVAEGLVHADDLVTMRDVVLGLVRPPADRPLVFKSVGMSWQDLVVADAVARRTDG